MKINGNLWIDIGGQGKAGYQRIRLLELIQETGSIKKAAETIGMSYKAAWDNINSLNEIYGRNLVERTTGGRGGGGTKLTDHGRSLIKTYNHYSRIHELYLTDISNMNCTDAVMSDIGDGYGTALTVQGDTLSCALLDKEIKKGDKVSLFIKPSDIILVNSSQFETSARNLLQTEVVRVTLRDGAAEITLKTLKGTVINVNITSKSASKLKLEKGTEIFALFKTASVLAVLR